MKTNVLAALDHCDTPAGYARLEVACADTNRAYAAARRQERRERGRVLARAAGLCGAEARRLSNALGRALEAWERGRPVPSAVAAAVARRAAPVARGPRRGEAMARGRALRAALPWGFEDAVTEALVGRPWLGLW